MKRSLWILLLGCIFLVVTSCGKDDDDLTTTTTTAAEAYQMSNKVTFWKDGNGIISQFLVYMPIPQTNIYQRVENVTKTDGEVLTDRNYDNKVLYVERKDFPNTSYAVETTFNIYTKKVDVNMSSIKNIKPYDPNSEPCKRHLGDRGKYIMTSNPEIVKIGDELWQQSANVLDYARRCYEYVATHFRYINGSWRTLDEILQAGGGECGDFSTLVVNLLRYKGIPSRHNLCLTFSGGYHVWVDFYLEGYGWIPLDATYKNGNPQGDYFGKYNGECIVVMQDFCYDLGKEFQPEILQSYNYYYWYDEGTCKISSIQSVRKMKTLEKE